MVLQLRLRSHPVFNQLFNELETWYSQTPRGFRVQQSQNSGSFKPPQRRQISSHSSTPPQKKEEAAEVKTFELVLLRSADFLQDDDTYSDIIPDYNKLDADVCCTGMVDLFANADEISIKSSIQEVLINRIPDINGEDFEFLKIKGQKSLKKGEDIGYKQLKALTGQGAVYVRLKNKQVLIETDTASHSKEVVEITDGKTTPLDVVTTNTSSTQGPQPSCGSASVTTSSQQPGSSSMSSNSANSNKSSHTTMKLTWRVFYQKVIRSMMPS